MTAGAAGCATNPSTPRASVNADRGPSVDVRGAEGQEGVCGCRASRAPGPATPARARSRPALASGAVRRWTWPWTCRRSSDAARQGREVVARCPSRADADQAALWLVDRPSRSPGLRRDRAGRAGWGAVPVAARRLTSWSSPIKSATATGLDACPRTIRLGRRLARQPPPTRGRPDHRPSSWTGPGQRASPGGRSGAYTRSWTRRLVDRRDGRRGGLDLDMRRAVGTRGRGRGRDRRGHPSRGCRRGRGRGGTVMALGRFRTGALEVARVLRPGGVPGLVWNDRDESDPWIRRQHRSPAGVRHQPGC